MTLPNFLIIGAAKSGTTALHHYLRQHPQVYMSPQKETNFFAFEGRNVAFTGPGDEGTSNSAITSLHAYEKQFEAASDELAIGEASPWYLYSSSAAANIRRHLPDAKLIVVLRNPVDRAFSSYLHVVRDGRENLSFEDGLLAEEDRIRRGWEYIWHYRRAGLYTEQVERFLTLFGREQLRFYLYDDFLADPALLLSDVYEFLGVDSGFVASTSLRPNTTGVPKNQLLGRLLFQPNPLKATAKRLMPQRLRYDLGQRLSRRVLKKPSISEPINRELTYFYEDDVLALSNLIGRDLSAWSQERRQLA